MAEQDEQTPQSSEETTMARPQRWAQPFDPDMTDEDLDSLTKNTLFKDVDITKFPKHIPFEGILRNDTRIVKFSPGEIVVREGDYGNSAFLVLKGKLRVVLTPSLPRESIGRSEESTRSFFESVSQLWTSKWTPETRDTSKYTTENLLAGKELELSLIHI